MGEPESPISRQELLELHKHFTAEVNQHLGFCYRYLNFYAGLLSAILAGTITGLFKFELESPIGLVLVTGPGLIGLLAWYGYKTVKVFYHRFIEAWITSRNLEEMLGLRESLVYERGIHLPQFKSTHGGGFMAEFERPPVRAILDRAKRESWSAEKLLDEIVKTGDTLKFAKMTFISFAVACLLVAGAIIWATLCT